MRKKLIALSDDPVFAKKVHGWAVFFWLGMAVPSMLLWSQSVPYLVGISVYAVVTGHWGGYQAASAECRVREGED